MLDSRVVTKALTDGLIQKIETVVEAKVRSLTHNKPNNFALSFDEELVLESAANAIEELTQW